MSEHADLSHIPEEVRKAYEKETEQRAGESHQAWTSRALHALEDLLHRYPKPDPAAVPPAPVLPVPPAATVEGVEAGAPESPPSSTPTADGSPGVAG